MSPWRSVPGLRAGRRLAARQRRSQAGRASGASMMTYMYAIRTRKALPRAAKQVMLGESVVQQRPFADMANRINAGLPPTSRNRLPAKLAKYFRFVDAAAAGEREKNNAETRELCRERRRLQRPGGFGRIEPCAAEPVAADAPSQLSFRAPRTRDGRQGFSREYLHLPLAYAKASIDCALLLCTRLVMVAMRSSRASRRPRRRSRTRPSPSKRSPPPCTGRVASPRGCPHEFSRRRTGRAPSPSRSSGTTRTGSPACTRPVCCRATRKL